MVSDQQVHRVANIISGTRIHNPNRSIKEIITRKILSNTCRIIQRAKSTHAIMINVSSGGINGRLKRRFLQKVDKHFAFIKSETKNKFDNSGYMLKILVSKGFGFGAMEL